MKNESVGMGTAVPPSKNHVLINFLQKGAQEDNALNFYEHFQKKKWKNKRSNKLGNWKIAAWNWILIFESTNQMVKRLS
jgi:hypothetical protein